MKEIKFDEGKKFVDNLDTCPFCGGKAVFISSCGSMTVNRETMIKFEIKCNRCGIHPPGANGIIFIRLTESGDLIIKTDERKAAAAKWNKRADNV